MAAIGKDARIYIAGHLGLVGAALVRRFQRAGFHNLLLCTHNEVDLKLRNSVWSFFEKKRPEYVIVAAAKVGGIAANMAEPVSFLVDNLEIQNNV